MTDNLVRLEEKDFIKVDVIEVESSESSSYCTEDVPAISVQESTGEGMPRKRNCSSTRRKGKSRRRSSFNDPDVQKVTDSSKYAGRDDPVTGETIIPGTDIIVCPRCDTSHLAESWDAYGGCTTLGCKGSSGRRIRPRVESTPPVHDYPRLPESIYLRRFNVIPLPWLIVAAILVFLFFASIIANSTETETTVFQGNSGALHITGTESQYFPVKDNNKRDTYIGKDLNESCQKV
jgi:hypothetical protein